MLIDKLIEVLRWWTRDPIIHSYIAHWYSEPKPKLGGKNSNLYFINHLKNKLLLKSNNKIFSFHARKTNKFHFIREQMLSSSLVRFSSIHIISQPTFNVRKTHTNGRHSGPREALFSSTKQKTHKPMQRSKTKYSKLGWFQNHRSHACFWRCLS